MRRLRQLMDNESSDDFMELSDDVFEDSGAGDDLTASEIEQGAQEREAGEPKTPFFQFCQKELKGLEGRLEVQKSKEFSEKQLTSALAKRWTKQPNEKRKRSSASNKWYTEDFLIPVLTDNVPEKWERRQQSVRTEKNIYVDKDKAKLLVRMGNSRSNAVCQVDDEACSASVSMITARGPLAEVNLAINVMLDEETRLILAIAIRGEPKRPNLPQKRFTAGQVDIQIKRELIADRLKQGKKPKDIMREFNCSEYLVRMVKKMVEKGESLAPKTSPGRPRKITAEFLNTMCSTYGADPFHTYSKTAEETGVSKTTVGRAVRELGMKPYIRRVRCLISSAARERRVERCEDLLEWLKDNGDSTVIIFSDKVNSSSCTLYTFPEI